MFKKVAAILLALVMVFALAACGGNDTKPTNNTPTTPTNPTNTQPTNSTPSQDLPSVPTEDVTPMKVGVAYSASQLTQKSALIKGVKLTGNLVGSAEWNNSRDYSLTDIRSIFELDEWIEFYIELVGDELPEPLHVFVLPHKANFEDYKDFKFETARDDNLAFTDLEKDPETECWGSFYVNPEDAEPDTYDLVFFVGSDLELVIPVHFYKNSGELQNKSAAELDQIINDLKK